MRTLLLILLLLGISSSLLASEVKTIHVFVALCDNQNQGIVPVPSHLGNGQDPASNLYWGAAYGVKSFLRYKSDEWIYVKRVEVDNPMILERILFKHRSGEAYLLADAYDGRHIRSCIVDFLYASNYQRNQWVTHEDDSIPFGGASDLVAYCGHDGLMEFDVAPNMKSSKKSMPAIVLACYSKDFFYQPLLNSGAQPWLWTTHLMAPEAYTLVAALEGWLKGETPKQVEERAAQAYNRYQKCGINGARNLFTTGFN
ncbi:hypothetical protein KFE98_18775 [bacterium SCSIO 12741]|nr:hypothetical protein KFE98_18775 [bacterium SCSIO 12741]